MFIAPGLQHGRMYKNGHRDAFLYMTLQIHYSDIRKPCVKTGLRTRFHAQAPVGEVRPFSWTIKKRVE